MRRLTALALACLVSSVRGPAENATAGRNHASTGHDGFEAEPSQQACKIGGQQEQR